MGKNLIYRVRKSIIAKSGFKAIGMLVDILVLTGKWVDLCVRAEALQACTDDQQSFFEGSPPGFPDGRDRTWGPTNYSVLALVGADFVVERPLAS
jgi:hypothetical protein